MSQRSGRFGFGSGRAFNPLLAWLGPLSAVDLVGDGVIRVVQLALPAETVESFLPYTLELASQSMTPRGTHPVVMFFQEMVRAHVTIPMLVPNMTYHEFVLAVPFTRVRGAGGLCSRGTLQFLPRLYLSEWLPTLGGILFWGFAKEMARYHVTNHRIALSTFEGDPLVSLDYQPAGDFEPPGEYPLFGPLREVMSEPLVSEVPAALGPLLACSNYDKDWSRALLRPIDTEVTIHQSFVPNLPCGRWSSGKKSITHSPLGSVEVKAPWRLSLLYPPWMA
jgi:hypothetical protein